jgi:hypothetical protein
MPTYEIEQYELCVMRYRIEAADEPEAIARLFDGQAEPVDDSQDFIEIARDRGLPAGDQQDLAASLRARGVTVDGVIPSIRSIEQVES